MSDDDLDPDVQQLVALARKARTPGEADKLRIAERLVVPLAVGAAAGTAAGTAKAAGGLSGIFAKIAAVVAVGAVAAGVVVSQRAPGAAPPAPSQQLATPPTAEEPTAPEARREEARELPPDTVAPTPPRDSLPKRSPSGAPSAKPANELAEEAALLHEAQSAWRAGQSAQALKLANQHAQRFPRSQLGSERDVLRVLSLCKLGQVQAAKQIGAPLLKRAKGSPWYRSVAESCAAN